MKRYLWRIVAGLLLIAGGTLLLLSQLGLIAFRGPTIGSLILIGGAAFFLTLWLSDTSEWWPAIPGGVMLAWGVSALLSTMRFPSWVTSLVGFVGSALPFAYIFLMDRAENWWALIPGGVLSLVGVAVTMGELVGGDWVAAFVLWGIALVFVMVFAADRRNWWALIPAGVMTTVGLGVSPLAPLMQLLLPAALIVIGLALVLRVLLGWH